MVDQIIRPADLPNRASPNASEKIPVDNGSNVAGATVESIVLAGRPTASQAEAEAGTDAVKAMTPLTTKQAIDAQVPGKITDAIADLNLGSAAQAETTDFATSAQGLLADSAVQSIGEGSDISVDVTDPQNPVVSYVGAGVSDGDKGDVIVSEGGEAWNIADEVLAPAKLVPEFSDRLRWCFDTIPELFADTSLSYDSGNMRVAVGDNLIAENSVFRVAASGASNQDKTLAGGVKVYAVPRANEILCTEFGVNADNNSTDETALLQAALNKAATLGNLNKGAVRIPRGMQVYLASQLTIPANVALIYEGAQIRTNVANSILVNNNSELVGPRGIILTQATFSGNLIRAENTATVTSGVLIEGGIFVGGQNSSSVHHFMDLSSIYNSRIRPHSISSFDIAYNQTGTVQGYYNEIVVPVVSCGRAMNITGTLFNGNQIRSLRCNVSVRAFSFTNGAGNTLNLTYIEGGFSGNGIFLQDTTNMTIIGGIIEMGANSPPTTVGIRGINADNTVIMGTSFGGANDGASNRVNFDANCINTTIIGNGGVVCQDGAITTYP